MYSNPNFVEKISNIRPFGDKVILESLHVHEIFECMIAVMGNIDDTHEYFTTLRPITMLKEELPPLPLLKYYVMEGLHSTNNSNIWPVVCFLVHSPAYAVDFNSPLLTWTFYPSDTHWVCERTNAYFEVDKYVNDLRICLEQWQEGNIPKMGDILSRKISILDHISYLHENVSLKTRLIEAKMNAFSRSTLDDFSSNTIKSLSKAERVHLYNAAWKGMRHFLENQG